MIRRKAVLLVGILLLVAVPWIYLSKDRDPPPGPGDGTGGGGGGAEQELSSLLGTIAAKESELSSLRQRADALRAEVARAKGVRDDLPPFASVQAIVDQLPKDRRMEHGSDSLGRERTNEWLLQNAVGRRVVIDGSFFLPEFIRTGEGRFRARASFESADTIRLSDDVQVLVMRHGVVFDDLDDATADWLKAAMAGSSRSRPLKIEARVDRLAYVPSLGWSGSRAPPLDIQLSDISVNGKPLRGVLQ